MSKEQTTDLLKFLKPFSKEINETVFWKIACAVESHVFDKVGKALLVVFFEDGSCFDDESQFGSLFGLFIGANIVMKAIGQLAHGDLRFDGYGLIECCLSKGLGRAG